MLGMFTGMVLVMAFCIFPMLARFEMKTFDSFRNALVFGIVHLPRVVLGLIMFAAPFVISIWAYKWAWLIWLFAACVALYYNSRFFIKSFDKLEEKTFGPKEAVEDPEYLDDSEETNEESDMDESVEDSDVEDTQDSSEENDESDDEETGEETEEE